MADAIKGPNVAVTQQSSPKGHRVWEVFGAYRFRGFSLIEAWTEVVAPLSCHVRLAGPGGIHGFASHLLVSSRLAVRCCIRCDSRWLLCGLALFRNDRSDNGRPRAGRPGADPRHRHESAGRRFPRLSQWTWNGAAVPD